jgi:cytochrome b
MPMPPEAGATTRAVRVWDLPTRLFHWALTAAVIGSVVTAKIGGSAMTWHFRIGFVVLGLLLFRLVWGLVGGHWSRFGRFVYGPGAVLRYLRGRSRDDEHHDVGHNPLGSFSVFALLAMLLLQVATGLVADDEIANRGPLNRFVASSTAGKATHWHHDYGQWIIIALVALHVLAILWYLLRQRRNLIAPMIGGDKLLPPGTPAARDGAAQRLLALALALGCAAVVWWIVRLEG